jgi:hypothetical protein
MVPTGTYNVELLNVLSEKELYFEFLPYIVDGFSISETTMGISASPKAASSIDVALLGMVTDLRLLQP